MSLNSTTVRTCIDCAVDISDRNWQAVYCTSCKPRQHRKATSCMDCGIDLSHRHGNTKRCPSCVIAYARQVKQTPEYREQSRRSAREYARRPENKARICAYKQTPQYKVWMREYNRRPEVRQRANSRRREPDNVIIRREEVRQRRAKKYGQTGTVTPDVLAKLESATHCAVCGQRFTTDIPKHIDHVVPIARGGLHDNGNLQALCASCNYQKHVKDPIDFARQHGRLL